MTRATKMANAGANMFKAVPLITWFAFILMEAYPWNREKNMPVAMEIKTARISCIWPLMVPPPFVCASSFSWRAFCTFPISIFTMRAKALK